MQICAIDSRMPSAVRSSVVRLSSREQIRTSFAADSSSGYRSMSPCHRTAESLSRNPKSLLYATQSFPFQSQCPLSVCSPDTRFRALSLCRHIQLQIVCATASVFFENTEDTEHIFSICIELVLPVSLRNAVRVYVIGKAQYTVLQHNDGHQQKR